MQNQSYEKGDLIEDKWRVLELLGVGGFGEVYLAENLQWGGLCALKTIRAEYLGNLQSRESFKSEALLWLDLAEHEFIVAARWVAEVSGRLLVQMDYIAPDEMGRVSLLDHLVSAAGPLETDRILKWAIQFCYGMEYAHRNGIKCHQDIKPSNILITADDTLKISDFGLAQAATRAWQQDSCSPTSSPVPGSFSFSLVESRGKRICGTPGYIAPELFLGNEANVESDIYGFGLVLWQMATGSPVPPFHVPLAADVTSYIYKVLERQRIGHFTSVEAPLQSVVARCLAPESKDRYRSFDELRLYLELVWHLRTWHHFEPPKITERTSHYWMSRGSSLSQLGQHEEALACLSEALEFEPQYVDAWNNKGLVLVILGRFEEALPCFSKCLELDPGRASFWSNKGAALHALADHLPHTAPGGLWAAWLWEASLCFEKAIHLDPQDIGGWLNKGRVWGELNRHEQALECYSEALKIDPRNTTALYNIGNELYHEGKFHQSIGLYEQVLEIDPLDASAWRNKAAALFAVDHMEEAITCYDEVLRIEPKDSTCLRKKGEALGKLGRSQEALACYREASDLIVKRSDA